MEPTESESKKELDRFCDTMIGIKQEIDEIVSGKVSKENNVLINAPHTVGEICSEWDHPYSREAAVFPAQWLKEFKYWPPVGRIENAAGDRNLVCTCPDISEYE